MRQKVTILSPMSDTPRAQLIHIDVDRRLGHEWDEWDGKPLPNQRELRFARRRCSSAGPPWRSRSDSASRRSPCTCSPPASPAPPHAATAPLDRARCRECGALALVGGALPLIWDRARTASRTARGARSVPPAHAAHLPRSRPVRPPRLGRERVGEGLQCARPAPAAKGRQGRAAAADPPLPLEGDVRWGPGDRGEVWGAGVRGHARPARAAGHP